MTEKKKSCKKGKHEHHKRTLINLLLGVFRWRTLLSFSLLLLCQSLLLGELLGSEGLGTVVLADGLEDGLLLLGLDDGDGVREVLLGTGLSFGVGAAHDLDLDTEDTLAEEDVTGGAVDEFFGGLTGVDHESVLQYVSHKSTYFQPII